MFTYFCPIVSASRPREIERSDPPIPDHERHRDVADSPDDRPDGVVPGGRERVVRRPGHDNADGEHEPEQHPLVDRHGRFTPVCRGRRRITRFATGSSRLNGSVRRARPTRRKNGWLNRAGRHPTKPTPGFDGATQRWRVSLHLTSDTSSRTRRDTRQWYAHTRLMLVTGGASNGAWRAPRDSGAPLRGITCNFGPTVFLSSQLASSRYVAGNGPPGSRHSTADPCSSFVECVARTMGQRGFEPEPDGRARSAHHSHSRFSFQSNLASLARCDWQGSNPFGCSFDAHRTHSVRRFAHKSGPTRI